MLETNNWAEYVMEDVAKAFERLAQLANDEHAADSKMTAEEYYGIRLAALIKGGPVAFDAELLH